MNFDILKLNQNQMVVNVFNDDYDNTFKFKINSERCTKDVFDPGSLYGHDNVFTNERYIEELVYSKENVPEKELVNQFKCKERYIEFIEELTAKANEYYINERWIL